MTEAEWLACVDPTPMLEFLTEDGRERKLRLFGVACCRRFWHLLDDEHCKKHVDFGVENRMLENGYPPFPPLNSCRKAIELAERAADEPVSPEELDEISEAAFAFNRPATLYCAGYVEGWGPFDGELVASGSAASAAEYASKPYLDPNGVASTAALPAGCLRKTVFGEDDEAAIAAERSCQCDILRDIFGNPFRPVALTGNWQTPETKRIAQQIYDDRAFDRLPQLADAIEAAGCTDADILSHCRAPGPHVRGCWAVDLILGRM